MAWAAVLLPVLSVLPVLLPLYGCVTHGKQAQVRVQVPRSLTALPCPIASVLSSCRAAVGMPPVEAPKAVEASSDGKAAPKESLVSLLVNDCLKWVLPLGQRFAGAGWPSPVGRGPPLPLLSLQPQPQPQQVLLPLAGCVLAALDRSACNCDRHLPALQEPLCGGPGADLLLHLCRAPGGHLLVRLLPPPGGWVGGGVGGWGGGWVGKAGMVGW